MDSIRIIDIKEQIRSDNRNLADEIRSRLRREKTYLLNLMSSPGSGKTSLILKTLERLSDEFRMAAIEADIDSLVDSEKIAALGFHTVQIRTGGFCHVDAAMVDKALKTMDLSALDLIILENVGNLVCPADSDTGAIANVMILSVPEGDDKPLKYPLMFTVSSALVVNKIDYLDGSDFEVSALHRRVRSLNPAMEIFEVSCRTNEGIEAWSRWLAKCVLRFLRSE
jgi:hydrogenase nickel incorporation protein HypB